MPVATPVKIDSSDSFRLYNSSEKALTFSWNKRSWKITPGESAFVPFDVVRLYFGDPRSIVGSSKRYRDSKGEGDIPKREDEVRRLAVLYGLYDQALDLLPTSVPHCIAETAHGEELNLPAFDPTGVNSPKESSLVDLNNIDTVNAIIQSQQQQLDEMRRRMDSLRGNSTNSGEDVTVDGEEEFATLM